ncbi:hypothetical protein Bbelb_203370 [Branchiostoma belcheri]|nr:hypothetical protein Bbelb_203370 [Branchiostoma belcheri]
MEAEITKKQDAMSAKLADKQPQQVINRTTGTPERLSHPVWLQDLLGDYARLAAGLINCHARPVKYDDDPKAFLSGSEEMDLDTFYRAVEEGDVQTVRRGLDAGVDIRVKRWWGESNWTSLHVASRYGQTEVAALLIEHGADLEAREERDQTSLHVASRYGRTEVAVLLIEHGADLEAKDKYANVAWCGVLMKDSDLLESVQVSAARACTGAMRDIPTTLTATDTM